MLFILMNLCVVFKHDDIKVSIKVSEQNFILLVSTALHTKNWSRACENQVNNVTNKQKMWKITRLS